MEKQVHPNISVDCVIFGFDFRELNVILVERKLTDPISGEILIDDFTLAGNHVFVDEQLDAAARRVLFNLSGLHDIFLEQFYTTGDPDRLSKPLDQIWLKSINKNPYERVVSVCYYSLINSSQVAIASKDRIVLWTPVKEIKNLQLAFDHAQILQNALQALRNKLKHEPICFELLPKKFTLSQLQRLYEVVFDTEFDKRNFRKKLSKMKFIIKLEEKQVGVSHKPATYFSFDRTMYETYKSEILNFSL
jgi:hypothetical protein